MDVILRGREYPACRTQVFHFLECNYIRTGFVQVFSDSCILSRITRPAALIVYSREVFNIPGDKGEVSVGRDSGERRQNQP